MITIVGIGPGGREHMTGAALDALSRAETIVGYSFYIGLLGSLADGKKVVSTGMTRETERCEKAVELALAGEDVAVVSTGDPGVYGMAGLVLEILEKRDPGGTVEAEVVPGLSAANAAASVLGAPLMSDYAVVSLSDLMTPWVIIEKRLKAAATGDFVTALYNPRSRKRRDHFDRAAAILGTALPPSTPVGIVRNALREGQESVITTLSSAGEADIDMMSVVIVGNSLTRIINGRMVTPRGYGLED